MSNTTSIRSKSGPAAAETANKTGHNPHTTLGNMMGLGTYWMEAVSDMGVEVASFIAARIKEDVKTQHAILHCKTPAELHHIQADFVQTAVEQYQAETGKLIQMGAGAFADQLN